MPQTVTQRRSPSKPNNRYDIPVQVLLCLSVVYFASTIWNSEIVKAEEQKVLRSESCLPVVEPLTSPRHPGGSCEILSTSLFPQLCNQREVLFPRSRESGWSRTGRLLIVLRRQDGRNSTQIVAGIHVGHTDHSSGFVLQLSVCTFSSL